MSRNKILIIDDSSAVRMILQSFLQNHDMAVQTASSCSAGFSMVKSGLPDIIVCDVGMEDFDGFTLCRKLRDTPEYSKIPVILISGEKISENDMLSGYNFGADDYLLKPFSNQLLLAKINAVMRRYSPKDGGIPQAASDSADNWTRKLDIDGLSVDFVARTAVCGGKKLSLTQKEFDILTVLMLNYGKVISYSSFMKKVWGYNFDYLNAHTLKVHVFNLKKKLGSFSRHIVSVRGMGFRFDK